MHSKLKKNTTRRVKSANTTRQTREPESVTRVLAGGSCHEPRVFRRFSSVAAKAAL